MGRRPKVHLRLKRRFTRSACGLDSPRLLTNRASNVTCVACQRTLAMAECELRPNSKK